MRREPLAVSFALHIAVAGSLLLLSIPGRYASPAAPSHPTADKIAKLLPPPPLNRPKASPALAGGGSRSPLPPSKGVLPSKPEARVFLPPQLVARERTKLTLPTGIEDLPKLPPGAIGDPNGKGIVPSGGSGSDGFGGDGLKGYGPGPGGPPGGSATPAVKKPSKWPQLLFKAEPEYSEPARKARHQGTVLLAVEIDADGLPRNIRVVRGLGMGLDEKAMDAVSTWRFKPALYNGKPVSAPITVEVNFRLL